MVANHPPVITDYGLYLIVLAYEQKIITIADVFDLDNSDKLSLESTITCHHNPTNWINLSFVDLKVILKLEVP